MGVADFFGGVQVVHLESCIENSRLDGARGSGALPLAVHVAFVGGSREQEMVVNNARQETGECCQLFAALKCRSNVVVGGEQRAWWINSVYSAAVEVASALAAIAVGGCPAGMSEGAVVAVAASGTNHSPVQVHLSAHRTMRPRCEMVHPILVNTISQPALHSVTTEMREWDAKLGMMWAWRAAAGSAGMSNVQVCVDLTRSPLGRRAMMGVVVG